MELRAGGDVIEAAFPGERIGDKIARRGFGANGSGYCRQRVGRNLRSVGEYRGTFESVLEFTNIAGPGIGGEAGSRFCGQFEWALGK